MLSEQAASDAAVSACLHVCMYAKPELRVVDVFFLSIKKYIPCPFLVCLMVGVPLISN
jgi:hypothetical protein